MFENDDRDRNRFGVLELLQVVEKLVEFNVGAGAVQIVKLWLGTCPDAESAYQVASGVGAEESRQAPLSYDEGPLGRTPVFLHAL